MTRIPGFGASGLAPVVNVRQVAEQRKTKVKLSVKSALGRQLGVGRQTGIFAINSRDFFTVSLCQICFQGESTLLLQSVVQNSG